MSREITTVYTGSIVEARFLTELLEENQISCRLRDSFGESVIAGWGSGSSDNAARIEVETSNAEKAKELIEAYLNSR